MHQQGIYFLLAYKILFLSHLVLGRREIGTWQCETFRGETRVGRGGSVLWPTWSAKCVFLTAPVQASQREIVDFSSPTIGVVQAERYMIFNTIHNRSTTLWLWVRDYNTLLGDNKYTKYNLSLLYRSLIYSIEQLINFNCVMNYADHDWNYDIF